MNATKARYLRLICGHYSTLEEQEAVSLWKPKRGLYWCDLDDDWVKIAPPRVLPADYPDEPLF